MNLKKFTSILLKCISNSDIAPLNIERYPTDNHSFYVTTQDNHIFLIKIGEIDFKDIITHEKKSDADITTQSHIQTKNDFLKLMDNMIQNNPLLMNLLFSTWKLREMNLITDLELDKIQKGLEKNKDNIFIDFIQRNEMMDN